MEHTEECAYLRAVMGETQVGVCAHGFLGCPVCTPCTCDPKAPKAFYEVLCWDKNGRFCRAADDRGLQWFTTLEQAETITEKVAHDPDRPAGMARIMIYRAQPIKEVKLA